MSLALKIIRRIISLSRSSHFESSENVTRVVTSLAVGVCFIYLRIYLRLIVYIIWVIE